MSTKSQPDSHKPEVRDERLTEGDHNGKGITNDRYSKSSSSQPKVSTSKDVRSGQEKPEDISDDHSSGQPSTHKGDPHSHSKSAQKSKI